MDRFQEKRVLVTGATSGIGLAGALRIADEGGEVIATGRDEEKLDQLRQLLPANATVLKNDASKPDDIRYLAKLVAGMNGLDGLWLNVGFARVGRIEEMSSQDFDEVMNANLKGPMLQMSALSKYLRKGASVVLTSSTSVYEGAPATSIYAAAKGALVSVARCWAAELGSDSIRVNTLIPGPINTAFRDFMPLESRKKFEAHVMSQLALPRIGTAEEAAAVATFLLSDDSSFVTGSQYVVDGGLLMQ